MPTIVDWPTGRAFIPASLQIEVTPSESVFTGAYTNTRFRRSNLTDRWQLTATFRHCKRVEAFEREAFFLGLKSKGDWVRMGLLHRKEPSGTARGTMVTSASAAAGARTLAISGATNNGTLLAGDWLSIASGNHLLQVAYPGMTFNGSGAGTVTLVTPLPVAVANGASVAWSNPTGLWELDDEGLSLSYSAPVMQAGFACVFRQAVQ